MSHPGLFDLKGRVALVTGAGQGVGRTLALTLAAHNSGGIVVNDFLLPRAEAVAEEVRALGVPSHPMQADVGDLEAVHAGVATAETALGPVEILVNNAGNGGSEGFPENLPPFWESDPAQWRRFLHVNLFGVMNCCHTVLPGMVARRYGRVLTIVSDAARGLESRLADYAAAKAGAAGFMRGLAADAARYGITANSIALGAMLPPLPDEKRAALLDDPRTKARLARYPIRRHGLAEDVAGTALLLCSDAASWITGQTYPVNGGYTAAL